MKYFVDLGKKRLSVVAETPLYAAVNALAQSIEKIKKKDENDNRISQVTDGNITVRKITDRGWDDSKIIIVPLHKIYVLIARFIENEGETY